jgi:hypothetical protein
MNVHHKNTCWPRVTQQYSDCIKYSGKQDIDVHAEIATKDAIS